MNANTQKLVNALRSGEFAQARTQLRTRSGYCCLGVACELYRRETGAGEWIALHGDDLYDLCAFRDDDGTSHRFYLSPKVVSWLNWCSESGRWDSDHSLAALNDGGEDFETIADAIEKHYEDLIWTSDRTSDVATTEG